MMRIVQTPPTSTAEFAVAAVQHCRAAVAQLAAISDEVDDEATLHALSVQSLAIEQVIDTVSRMFDLSDPSSPRYPELYVVAAE